MLPIAPGAVARAVCPEQLLAGEAEEKIGHKSAQGRDTRYLPQEERNRPLGPRWLLTTGCVSAADEPAPPSSLRSPSAQGDRDRAGLDHSLQPSSWHGSKGAPEDTGMRTGAQKRKVHACAHGRNDDITRLRVQPAAELLELMRS